MLKLRMDEGLTVSSPIAAKLMILKEHIWHAEVTGSL